MGSSSLKQRSTTGAGGVADHNNNYTTAGIGLDLLNNSTASIQQNAMSPNAPYHNNAGNLPPSKNGGNTYLQPPVRNALRGRGPLRGSGNDRKSSIGGQGGFDSSTGSGSPFPNGGIVGSMLSLNTSGQ